MSTFKDKIGLNWLLLVFTLSVIAVVFAYVIHFKGSVISNDPADWGVLGDYIGGILNPLISALTLFFVARTYLSQRDEIKRIQESAEKSDKLREQATKAQVSLANSYLKQIEITNRASKINVLSAKISAKYKSIEIYTHEISRVSEFNSSNPRDGIFTMDGEPLYGGMDVRNYINRISNKIRDENRKIEHLMQKIDAIR